MSENEIIERATSITGFMRDDALLWLYHMACLMNSVVELGSWKGRSTYALCSGCQGTVYAVDLFTGGNESHLHSIAKDNGGSVYDIFKDNVGHFHNLDVTVMDTVEAAGRLPDVDMVFIDASHDFESVSRDIMSWYPKTRKLLCGHDYHNDGVYRAVQQLVGPVQEAGDDIWFKPLA